MAKYIRWFTELSKGDVALVGGKGANLGEMTGAGILVPPGFCVTALAYKDFVEATGLAGQIKTIIGDTDVEDLEQLIANTTRVRELIHNIPVPPEIAGEIVEAYQKLCDGGTPVRVAVRSSATAEDLPEASFAGQQDTYLNVLGAEDVLEHVRRCWASLWTARATSYRQAQGFDHDTVYLSAVVQKMIQSERSGVAFTANPISGNRQEMLINASWGLGEAIVSGKVTPDEYVVDKVSRRLVNKIITSKNVLIVADPNSTRGTIETEVARFLGPDYVDRQCLTDDEVLILAEQLIRVDNHYQFPQDIEWGYENGTFYILQSRPITTLGKEVAPEAKTRTTGAEVLIRGMGAAPGTATGKVVLVKQFNDITRVKEGTVLVTVMTNPDMVPAMKRAAAIITDEGGRTCHAAIVSRELGVPCIVGAKNATAVLAEDIEVTVDASRGVVYNGRVTLGDAPQQAAGATAGPVLQGALWREIAPVTATKIYMNLGEPEAVTRYKDLPFDGIGLMRTEFIFTDHVGAHPMYLVRTGQEAIFVEGLSEGIAAVAQAIYPRPVVVRFSDFRTNEFRGLKGGEEVEPVENNPMIGWRGVSRYISPEYKAGFRLECQAMRKVREEYQLTNVYAMLPFVRTTWEVKKALSIMAEEGLSSNLNFKVWIMAEVPSVIFMADEFSPLIDGFSIGSNDLTQLILGADRDSGVLDSMGYFDERNPAVTRAITQLIEVAHRFGKTVSICGQGPSVYPEFTELLVRAGIDSISVNPDTVSNTRRLVASVEQKVILEALRQRK
ncbi:MAG: phosphoenolpyruvate synthase [Bacillota bacterium]